MCKVKWASVALLMAAGAAFAESGDIAKWDSRMAIEKASVDTNGVKWIDGQYLPLEGKVFSNTDEFYDRLPSTVTSNVNAGVRSMKHHTAGLQFRFKTDSKSLDIRWAQRNEGGMDHMAMTGTAGIDVYRRAPGGKWQYYATGRVWGSDQSLKKPWIPGEECLINLPLYNGVKYFRLGIDKDATIEALGPRESGIDKPVVFYGTSITHGGCCCRPGLAFVNIIGRDLDVPVVNLGFSGCGRMELEMSEHLAAIDASCYVLDCVWNMDEKMVRERYEPFIRNLRAKRPDVPIVMAEWCDVFMKGPDARDNLTRALYEKLADDDDWENLVYLPKDKMFNGDFEGTVDGVHPNDRGMQTMAEAYGEAVREALDL